MKKSFVVCIMATALIASAAPGYAAESPPASQQTSNGHHAPGLPTALHKSAGAKLAEAPPKPASSADSTTPWAVSLGDSFISGEAGRWAGNTNDDSSGVDAWVSSAYYDNDSGTAESIPGCHRSKSAEVYFGAGTYGKNLACSGSTVMSGYNDFKQWKPGLDFADEGNGNIGQALALERFADTHPVKMLVVGIGGNDFNFAGIMQTCVTDFLTSSSGSPDYCSTDPDVTQYFTPGATAAIRDRIYTGLGNLAAAMASDGYTTSDYTIVVQTYPSPLPPGAGIRYPETGFTRQTVGGCGLWNADADWANNVAVPAINTTLLNAAASAGLPNIQTLDASSLLTGHRLCETGVHTLDETLYTNWQQAGWSDAAEWVNQIRTLSTGGSSPYYVQESLHPNYFGQLALRDCLRQVYNFGFVQGGTCKPELNGLNASGEPNTRLLLPLAHRQCAIQAPTVTGVATSAAPTAAFTNYANTTPNGWTGADSTFSVKLADGRIVWIFSDTFLGPLNADHTRPVSAPLINNSFVVQDGNQLTTVQGGTAAQPAAIMPPPQPGHWYWSGDGQRTDSGWLQVIYEDYYKTGTSGWDFAYDHSQVATFDPSDLSAPITTTSMPVGGGTIWGSAILPASASGDGYTYVYGVRDAPTDKGLRLARVHGSDLDTPSWQFYTPDGWVVNPIDAADIVTGTSDELSVTPWRGGFLLVSQDTTLAFSALVYGYTGCDPYGPFTNKTQLYRMPETGPYGSYGNPNVYAYNAHVHAEQSSDTSLLISYNVNSLDTTVTPTSDMYRDTSIYRPRFIRVQLG